MLDKATEFDNAYKKSYLEAVEKFRLPYWDYFRPRGTNATYPGITRPGKVTKSDYDFRMPDIFNQEKVMVRIAPQKELLPIENPLYTFKWDKDHGIQMKHWDNPKLFLSICEAVPITS